MVLIVIAILLILACIPDADQRQRERLISALLQEVELRAEIDHLDARVNRCIGGEYGEG